MSRDSRGNAHEEPKGIAESLRKLTKDLGLTDPDVLVRLRRHWADVVGDAVAQHATPSSLRDGVLTVTVDAPQWATQVRYLATEVKQGLSERGIEVGELQVRVGRGPG